MDPATLRAAILSNPELAALFAAGHSRPIVDYFAQPSGTKPVAYRLNKRDLYRVLGIQAGAAIRVKMEEKAVPADGTFAAKVAAEIYAEVLEMLADLRDGGGIDIGNAESRGMVAQMVRDGVLTQQQANTLGALATGDRTLGEATFGEPVTINDVRAAANLGRS